MQLKERPLISPSLNSKLCLTIVLAALVASVLLLMPGLNGGFYLDDFVNLGGLAAIGEGWRGIFSFLLNVPVGGSYRPLSYLTFIAQADSWPDQPFNFKVVNLSIHLTNGVLVGALAYAILSKVLERKFVPLIIFTLAVICGFIWVILPINMSSVFYVVQRMTLLSTTMSLVAIVGFAYLRLNTSSWSLKHYVAATLFIGFGYFGVFAKESAILTGVLVLVLEACIFSMYCSRPLNSVWKFGVLVLPLVGVMTFLLLSGKIVNGYASRDFSLVERVVSQSVILFDYFLKIVFPTSARINIYNDDFPFRQVVANWPLVIAACLGIAAAVFAGIGYRRKLPLITFGLLFFLAGHLLESTVIPLELYFEHRNYLPSIGIVIALVGCVGALALDGEALQRQLRMGVIVLSAGLAGWYALVTSVEAKTWGDLRAFAISALTERPNSLRARQEMAAYFLTAKDYMGAANLLYSIDSDFGVYAGTYAQLIMLKCYRDDIPLPDREELVHIFKSAPFDQGAGVALNEIREIKRSSPGCPEIETDLLLEISSALLENPAYKHKRNFYTLRALMLAEEGMWLEAASTIESAPVPELSVPELILIARFYSFGNQQELALKALNSAEESADGMLDQFVYQSYIAELRKTITIESKDHGVSGSSKTNE